MTNPTPTLSVILHQKCPDGRQVSQRASYQKKKCLVENSTDTTAALGIASGTAAVAGSRLAEDDVASNITENNSDSDNMSSVSQKRKRTDSSSHHSSTHAKKRCSPKKPTHTGNELDDEHVFGEDFDEEEFDSQGLAVANVDKGEGCADTPLEVGQEVVVHQPLPDNEVCRFKFVYY